MPLSKEQIEIERVKFEKCIDHKSMLKRDLYGNYKDSYARFGWALWQTALNEFEIQLPEAYMDGLCESIEKHVLIPHLEAQGFKVKS